MIPGGQIVVVNFRPGAGGKFIQNCLALSQHCVLKKPSWVRWQLDCPVSQYKQKLHWAKTTIPPNELVHQWLSFELRDDGFFGAVFKESNIVVELPDYLHSIAQAGLWCTYSSHSYGAGKLVEAHWPCVRYVQLSPADDFANHWLPRKNSELHNEGDTYPDSKVPEDLAFYFDIDNTIYNPQLFMEQMSKLYSWLGWTDFDAAPIEEYYSAYISVHK